MSELIEKSIADFHDLQAQLPGSELPWLTSLREQAVQQFSEHGYPTPRHEAWKYTNVASIIRKGYQPIVESDGAAPEPDISAWLMPELNAIRLCFVDGHFAPSLSDLAGLPDGAVIASLNAQLQQAPEQVEACLASHAAIGPQGFAELNTAFMSDGVFIRLPDGIEIERPVHLVHVARKAAQPGMAFLRNLVFAGKGSRVTLIEHFVSADGAQAMINAMTQCVLAQDAGVEHYLLNEQGDGINHFGAVHVHQDRNSHYVSHNLQAGARLARSDLVVELAGEGCESTLNGFYIGQGKQHIDNYLRIEHQVPHCSSRQLYKGVLDGRSRGIFNGHVIVKQDAQQTDAQQMNRNLLLSDQAEADTRPQLEIYADDVKCSHGATIGQIDHEALFYLRARGIDADIARRLLIGAFAIEVTEQLGLAPVRQRFERLVAQRLAH